MDSIDNDTEPGASLRPEIRQKFQARLSALDAWHKFLEWSLTKQAPSWIFRGQAQAWPLRPSIGRHEYKPELELLIFNEFKRHSVAYSAHGPAQSEWDWLALAQHHGLRTRLLDWTYNPLVAAYFACSPSPRGKKNGVICATEVRHFGFQDRVASEVPGPFSIAEICFLRTPSHVARIRAQKGMFSVHPHPDSPFPASKLTKFEIPAEFKASFRRLIYNLGVDAGFLMADLDGLCATLNWRHENGFIS